MVTLLTEDEAEGIETGDELMITICIPAFNEEKTITRTLTSVLQLDYPHDKVEVIVVNDGSSDNTQEITEQLIKNSSDRNIVLINQENKGKGAALNVAIDKCTGTYFVCMDADSTIESNALRKMIPYYTSENVAVVLPCLKVEDTDNPNIFQKMQRYEYLVSMFYKELMSRLDCIRVAPGPFSMYKTDIVKKVGYFDENNLTEDLEMAIRLQKHQYRLVQTFKTSVYTIAPRTFKAIYHQRNRWYKGSFLNTLGYRKMIFNRKFGDFGIMQMPITLISGFLTLAVIGFLLYRITEPVFTKINNWSLINYDIIPLIKTFSWNFSLLDLNYGMISVGVVLGIISIFVLKRAHSITGERVMKYGMIPLMFYMAVYFFILGVVWLGVAYDLVRKKQQRW